MKKFILAIFLFTIGTQVSAQKRYEYEKYKVAVSYPYEWRKIDNPKEEDLGFFYVPLAKKKKTNIGTTYNVNFEKARFDGDLKKMEANYRKELSKRTDFAGEEILSLEYVEYKGVKAIDLSGQAKVPVVKQAVKWRMLLFEYRDVYFEISFTAKKSEFGKKKTQEHFQVFYDTFEFLD